MLRVAFLIASCTLAAAQVVAQVPGDHAEAWFQNTPEGLAIFAQEMTPGRPCSLSLTRASGQVCVISSTDALGGTMETDAAGRLITRRAGFADDLPMAWACLGGNCAGGVALDACHDSANPLERATLACGSTQVSVLLGPQAASPPPSAQLALEFTGAAATAPATLAYFDVIPTLQFGDALPLPLCTVVVGINAGDQEATVLDRAQDAINTSPACSTGGVTAELSGGAMPHLMLSATDLVGAQLIPVVHAAPGEAYARCFALQDLGPPAAMQSQVMAVEFETFAGGAVGGGEITVTEHSPVGTCSIVTPTSAGQSAAVLVRNIRLGFQTPGIPGPASCPSSQNPRDVRFSGNRIITTLPSSVEVCVNDPGVGFTIRPEGLGDTPPGAYCDDLFVECTNGGQALVTLDASDSSDPDGDPLTFQWYEDYGGAGEVFLGTGETLDYPFEYGGHDVTVLVSNEAGQEAIDHCRVQIADTTPPTIAALEPWVLYPPNHEMVDLSVTIDAFDTCTGVQSTLISLASSEPDDAPGSSDGATTHDIQDAAIYTADFQFQLRAERDSTGIGRTYTAIYEVSDDAGNMVPAEISVRVPLVVGGLTDPIAISVGKGEDDTGVPTVDVAWTDAGGDREYNVVRGDVRSITETDSAYYLGPVDCLEVRTRTPLVRDSRVLAVGEASFYLVESVRVVEPVGEVVTSGFSSEDLLKPRTADRCIPLAGGPVPDPERDSVAPSAWGWLTGLSGAQVGSHLETFGERLVDIDRLGPDLYQSVQVANAGSTYGTPAFWWNDQTEAEVIDHLQATTGRILDLDPYEVNGQTLFSVSIIPNTGKRAKAWWWNYDQTSQQVVDAINTFGMRIIDLDAYQVGGVTRYSYVGVHNSGVDFKGWWLYFNISFNEVGQALADNHARLMDIEAHPSGNFTVVMVANDGKAWWWGAGLTAERVGAFVDNKGSRLVDLERLGSGGGEPTFAFISIDNVSTEEGRRLRPIIEDAFNQGGFGPNVTRGFLVKETNGPILAGIAAGLPFQPASTLKLLPYLYAVQEVELGNATLDGSTVSWLQDDNDEYAACLTSGTQASATFRNALPTMMWYSHNRTLDAFFDEYHPFDVVSPLAQTQWGMPNTVMDLGCTDEWLNNRSTLFELATMFEGVQNLALVSSAGSRDLFWNNVINQMQGNCAANIPGTAGCTCPSYAPNCPGNYYDSPYINMDGPDPGTAPDVVGPVTVGFLSTIVQQEGGALFDVNGFLDEVLIRQKGGSGIVADYPVTGFWEGYRSIAMYVSLPFKDGGGNIVPRNFTVAFFVNDWDGLCGGGAPQSASCKTLISSEDSDAFGTFLSEMFRLPIRMAVQTW